MKGTSFLSLLLLTSIVLGGGAIKVEISHFNDVSAQIESFEKGTSNSSRAPIPCPKGKEKECVGGLANIAHHLHEKLDDTVEDLNRLRICSGNVIGGESGWISARPVNNGWRTYAEEIVAKHYQPHVTVLGMKEFGAGVARTIEFVNKVPNVVLSNTCQKTYPEDSTEAKFCEGGGVKKVQELIVNDGNNAQYTIGVVGFVTTLVDRLSIPGKLVFSDIVTSLKAALSESSAKTFIAIGDGNLETAKQILESIPQIQLVIYGAGFSNTQDMTKKYPLTHGDHGYIVTAGRYGSTIGKLLIEIDSGSGKITKASGNIVETIRPEMLNQAGSNASTTFTAWESSINNLKLNTSVIGNTRVSLEGGEICWRGECNLGNLMTDAMVHCALQKPSKPFTFPIHAIWHGGAFFEDKIEGGLDIYKFDIHKWLPYHNRAHLVRVSGANLIKIFQEGVKGIAPEKAGVKDWRQFLQISNGMEIYIDTKSQKVPKLVQIRMTHDHDGVPRLTNLELTKDYYLVIPTYLYEGRGVYDFAVSMWNDVVYDNVTNNNIGFDDECLENYITVLKQVSVGFEERIWIDGNSENRPGSSQNCPGRKTAVTVILTMVFFSLFLAIIYVGYFYILPRLRRNNLMEQYPPNQL